VNGIFYRVLNAYFMTHRNSARRTVGSFSVIGGSFLQECTATPGWASWAGLSYARPRPVLGRMSAGGHAHVGHAGPKCCRWPLPFTKQILNLVPKLNL
jgi:hypothetical protein